MTLAKIMIGVVIGGLGSLALTLDEMKYRDEQLRDISKIAAPLKQECPAGTIKVATQAEGQDWIVRCAGRGKLKAM